MTLDRRLLFPRRFEFLRAESSDAGGEKRPLLVLSIDDVELDGPVQDAAFTFVPPDDVQIEDVTQAYIQALKAHSGTPQPAEEPDARP